jgi:hypothetical protein
MHSKGSNVSIVDTRGSVHKGIIECSGSNFNVTDSHGGHECYCLRDKPPEPVPEAQHCANDLGLSFCTCWGTVYYGRHKDASTNTSLDFNQMLQYGWTSILSNGDLMCTETSFDGDPDYGHEKQCFCAADPVYEEPYPVERCAEKEGAECECSGTVYYGRKTCPFDDTPLNYIEMRDYGFTSRQVEGTIMCGNNEFTDPAQGFPKQCFCEPDQEPQVKRCAGEDGTCKCNKGNVFYGLVEVDGYAPAGFDDLYSNAFAVKFNVSG